ncbi:DUF1707 domain-containing protein [Rhodococcus sp. IEGM 1409]|uniref:DUF1707 SHOCT-like domain-containing protein n=1 Tax=Rhodococcus sp. IEGM 1409 TaxID=3047082 RepID=UPI0024B69EAA|nr:DUF1707 domain-containing protein [Rhodococcus sp. IEGM 1409]MDI9902694.1 DUF1707 domain-containing protein [Rhodococcus sp. IEGM 1409]
MSGALATNSSRTRARDVDRADTCAVLDTAFADGQITADEHAGRTADAMKASTLGQLDLLVRDLQKATPRNAVAKVRRIDKIWYLAAASVVVATVIGFAALSGGDESAPAAAPVEQEIAAEPLAPIVSSTLDTTTASGIREFITRYNNKFGTTVIDSANFYDGHASVTRAAPSSPNLKEDIDFRGGFAPRESATSRAADTAIFDLASVDIDKLAGYLAGASANLNVPDAKVSHIGMGSSSGRPGISIYVENALGADGWMEIAPDGRPIRIDPFQP